MHWSAELLVTAVKEVLVFSVIGAGVSVVAAAVGAASLFSAFGFALLIEATGLMIIGGAFDLGSSGSAGFATRQVRMLFGRAAPREEPLASAEERKRTQLTAAKYSLTGVLLFLEALVLAFVLY